MAELSRADRVVTHAVGLTEYAMNNGVFGNDDMARDGFDKFVDAVAAAYARLEGPETYQEAETPEDDEKPARKRRTRRTPRDDDDEPADEPRERRAKRESKTGGKKRDGDISLKDAENMVLNFGAFEGVALGDLVDIDVDEAEADFHYGDGERDGADYLAGYLAGPKNHNKHVRDRARIVADDRGLEYDGD